MVAPKAIGTDLLNRRVNVASEMLDGLQVRLNRGGGVVRRTSSSRIRCMSMVTGTSCDNLIR